MAQVEIDFPKFITHVKISNARRAKKDKSGNIINKNTVGTPNYKKINSQFIYSGSPRTRASVVEAMKKYLSANIVANYDLESLKESFYNKEIRIKCLITCPYNYGNGVIMKKGVLTVYPVKKEYIPTWDIGNLGFIWSKCFDDVLKELGLIKDDNVSIVKSTGSIEFIRNDNFEERNIRFIIETTYSESETEKRVNSYIEKQILSILLEISDENLINLFNIKNDNYKKFQIEFYREHLTKLLFKIKHESC